MDDLDPFEFFALHSLTKRRPLFRWEAEAVTPEIMERLNSRGLVVLGDGQWKLTSMGELALQLKPVKVLGSVPLEPDLTEHDELSARRIARRLRAPSG